MTLVLNEKQSLTINKIREFIKQPNEKYFYLFGYAGTGKTYLINQIVKLALNEFIDHIYICAPTHKALNVLETYFKSQTTPKESSNLLARISFMTIHKLLEFKPIISNEDGTKVFKSARESKFLKQMEDRLIIIDECSMISSDMVMELRKYTDLYPIKIIFSGDNAQLPPVSERDSIVFTSVPKNYYYHIVLDQIMRTNSMDIKEVATIIRSWDHKESLSKLLLPVYNQKLDKKTFKLYHKKKDYEQCTWFKNFIKKLKTNDIPIVLTWKNVTSEMYNRIIRQYIHSETNESDLTGYLTGDYIMFNNFYVSPIDNSNFYTSDMVKILNLSTETKKIFTWAPLAVLKPKTHVDKALNTLIKKLDKFPTEFKINTLTIERVHSDVYGLDNDKSYVIQTIDLNDLMKYKTILKTIREHLEFFFRKYKSDKYSSKLWDIYHRNFIDAYAEINFGYSITTHKAQGSTFATVLVDVADIAENPDINEMQKALYTAATRASNELGFLLA